MRSVAGQHFGQGLDDRLRHVGLVFGLRANAVQILQRAQCRQRILAQLADRAVCVLLGHVQHLRILQHGERVGFNRIVRNGKTVGEIDGDCGARRHVTQRDGQAQRFRIICTDGVFSMDGNVAPMDKICDLAEKYDALVMVDESHSAGVVGATGHGVSELCKTYGRVDIYTGTLGKAFGGSLGGFTTGKKEIIDMLRQSSRPYLFSNSLAPGIIGASLEVFKMLKESNEIHDKLVENVNYFREKMMAAGFDIKPTQSAICAVMLYDAPLSQRYANRLLEEGIYVTGFYYPVVPKGEARIRVQLSAAHTKEQLDRAIAAFIKVGKELGVLK